jgi:hypothetical protein
VLAGVAAAVAAQPAFTCAPPLQAMFGTRPLGLADGAIILGLGVGLLLLLGAETHLRRRIGP